MSRTRKPGQATTPAVVKVPTAWKDRITAQDYEDLQNTFKAFDEDGSGSIDPEQISKVMEQLGLNKRHSKVFDLIEALRQKNRPIKFEQFLDIICSQVGQTKTKDGLRRVFNLYDQDQNGIIDFEEFKAVAKQIADPINDDELLQLMHSTFINNKTSSNEGFSFEEFYLIVSKYEGR